MRSFCKLQQCEFFCAGRGSRHKTCISVSTKIESHNNKDMGYTVGIDRFVWLTVRSNAWSDAARYVATDILAQVLWSITCDYVLASLSVLLSLGVPSCYPCLSQVHESAFESAPSTPVVCCPVTKFHFFYWMYLFLIDWIGWHHKGPHFACKS